MKLVKSSPTLRVLSSTNCLPSPTLFVTNSRPSVAVPLASLDLFRYPLVYLTGHLPVRFSDVERRTLREFCTRGGMLFVDDHNHDVDGQFHKTAWEEIALAVTQPVRKLGIVVQGGR